MKFLFRYNWKIYNDYFNTVDYAKKEGMAEGLAKGLEKGLAEGLAKGRTEEKLENARNFKKLGVSMEIIMQATGLTKEEIERL